MTDERPIDEERAAQIEAEEERRRRRLLLLILLLGLAVVGLLLLLLWRFGPLGGTEVEGARKGYPITVVRSLYGPERDPVRTPLGVGFDGRNVWIADTGKSRVVVMTVDGDFVRLVGDRPGKGRLSTPYGVTADRARDRVWVADWTGGALMAYSRSGRFLERFPAAEQDPAVFGEAGFTPFDVRILGSRVIAASNDGLYVFDRTGRVTARWGGAGRGGEVGQFNFPDAFDVDPKRDRVYVADSLNRRIVALDLDGNVEWVSGLPDAAGEIMGFWQLPRGIAVQPDGEILVVDTFRADENGVGTGHIVALSPEGELLSEFGRTGDADDAFSFPDHLAIGSDGLYAIADREHHRVVLFRLEGRPAPPKLEITTFNSSIIRPEGVNVLTRLPQTGS